MAACDSQKMAKDGFKHFLCSPLPGEMIQFDEYFSNGLVQPPPSDVPFSLVKIHLKVPGNFANPDKATVLQGNRETTREISPPKKKSTMLRWWCLVNLGQEFVVHDAYR